MQSGGLTLTCVGICASSRLWLFSQIVLRPRLAKNSSTHRVSVRRVFDSLLAAKRAGVLTTGAAIGRGLMLGKDDVSHYREVR